MFIVILGVQSYATSTGIFEFPIELTFLQVKCMEPPTAMASNGVCHYMVPCTIRRTSKTHTHTFNGPLSGTTRLSQYQKGKTNLDFNRPTFW